MRAIDKKLWRELWGMRLQALAIAMVIVSGVSIFIMSLSTLDSLYETRESYYRQHHFAEVFASLKRAPLSLASRIEEIAGVDKVETRVVASSPRTKSLLKLPTPRFACRRTLRSKPSSSNAIWTFLINCPWLS